MKHRRRGFAWVSHLCTVLLCLCVVLVRVQRGEGRAWSPRPKAATSLRIVSWNLENFPRPEQDLKRMALELEELQPDVLVVQEVRDGNVLQQLFPHLEFHLSERGGRNQQTLGVGFDPHRYRLRPPVIEAEELSLDGRVRPALVARLQPLRDAAGPSDGFTVVAVHLKATPSGFDQRRQQWSALGDLLEQLDDRWVIVAGDFNATGPTGGPVSVELNAQTDVLGRFGLVRAPLRDLACSAYWQGRRRDAWLEPSWLDMVWVRGPHRLTADVGGACARRRCRPIRSTAAYPELDVTRMSDHCPIWVDLASDAARET